jgi:DNA-binding PadR family transcriptional regulator
MIKAFLTQPQYGLSLVRDCDLSVSTVYPVLAKWKDKRLIRTCEPPPGHELAGENAIWYELTAEGEAILGGALREWELRHQPVVASSSPPRSRERQPRGARPRSGVVPT